MLAADTTIPARTDSAYAASKHAHAPPKSDAWLATRGEAVDFGAAWLRCHGLSVGSGTLGLSSRVRRAAPRPRTHSEEPAVASYAPVKAATLTMLRRLVGRLA